MLAGTVVLLLGLGIGANAVIVSIIHALLLKPLPVSDPQNLFSVEKNRRQQVRPDTEFYYPLYQVLSAKRDVFSSVVGEQLLTDRGFFALEGSGAARIVSTTIVSPNYFSDLGVKTVLGRTLRLSDSSMVAGVPAVISYQFWRSEYNADWGVIGRVLRLKNYPFRIVGVLPREFHSFDIELAPDVRLPLPAAPILYGQTVEAAGPHRPLSFELLARLAPGMTRGVAGPAVESALRVEDERLLRSFPQPDPKMRAGWEESIRGFCDYRVALEAAAHGVSKLRTQFSTALYVLLGAAGLLIFAVTANVWGLLLAHMEQRSGEVAVRLAIGATRTRVIKQLLLEYLPLTIPVTALAVSFALLMTPVLIHNLLPVRALRTSHPTPEMLEVQLSGSTMLLTMAVSLACLVVAALASTWRLWRTDIHIDLKTQKTGRASSLTSNALVALQVALSIVLMAGAVLTGRTFWNLEHTNPGFTRADLVEVTVDPVPAGYSEDQTRTFHSELLRRIAELPGVRSAASSWSEIMRGVGMKTTVSPAGVALPRDTYMNTTTNIVSEHYFTTMGIPLLAGRSLQPGDDQKRPQPLVVNTAFAKLLFPGQNPIGKFTVSGTSDGRKAPDGVIVGLVGTAKYRTLREENPPIAYSLEKPGTSSVFYARSYGNAASTLQAIRSLVQQIDPRVPIAQATTVEAKIQGTLWQEKLLTALANFFGLIALALAAAGVYGTLNYSVATRRRELGIRIAMGANGGDVVKSIGGRLGAAVAVGVVAGIVISGQLLAVARQLLFGVNLLDPSVLLLTIGAIVIPTLVAATMPIFRAIQIDPATALRTE